MPCSDEIIKLEREDIRLTYGSYAKTVYVKSNIYEKLIAGETDFSDPLINFGYCQDECIYLKVPDNDKGVSSMREGGLSLLPSERETLILTYLLLRGRASDIPDSTVIFNYVNKKILRAAQSDEAIPAPEVIRAKAADKMFELILAGILGKNKLGEMFSLIKTKTGSDAEVLDVCLRLIEKEKQHRIKPSFVEAQLSLSDFNESSRLAKTGHSKLKQAEERIQEARSVALDRVRCEEQADRYRYGKSAEVVEEVAEMSPFKPHDYRTKESADQKREGTPEEYRQTKLEGSIDIKFSSASNIPQHSRIKSQMLGKKNRFQYEVRFKTKLETEVAQLPNYRVSIAKTNETFELVTLENINAKTDLSSLPEGSMYRYKSPDGKNKLLLIDYNSKKHVLEPDDTGFFTDSEGRFWVHNKASDPNKTVPFVHHEDRILEDIIWNFVIGKGLHYSYIPKGFDLTKPARSAVEIKIDGEDDAS